MSYRAAWGKIKRTEEILGFKLIEKERGNKTGYRLTEAARTLRKSYRDWYQAIEMEALQKARELFPWTWWPLEQRAPIRRSSKDAKKNS